MHLQRADFGERGGQLHRDVLSGRGSVAGGRRSRGCLQRHHDGRQANKSVFVQRHQLAQSGRRLTRGIGHRAEQLEADRLTHAQGKGPPGQDHFLAGLAATRQDADATLPGHGAAWAKHFSLIFFVIEPQKVTARRAAADAGRESVLRQRIGHRTARHCHVGVVVVQQAQRCAAPCAQRLSQSLRQGVGAKHTPVEKQGIGHGLRVLTQKVGEVTGDGRVAGVGQAERHDAAARLSGSLASAHRREKSVHDELLDVCTGQRDRAAAPDQPGAAAQQCHCRLFRRISGQQQLLGGAAAVHQLCQPAGRQRRCQRAARRGGQARLKRVCQRQVHVVAAQH